MKGLEFCKRITDSYRDGFKDSLLGIEDGYQTGMRGVRAISYRRGWDDYRVGYVLPPPDSDYWKIIIADVIRLARYKIKQRDEAKTQ